MDLHDFYYDLPEELIAQDPLEKRSDSRMMVVHRDSGETEHRHFSDLLDYLKCGDCLVINDTKVIPARLLGMKKDTGAAVEVLLLKDASDKVQQSEEIADNGINGENTRVWECLVKPGKKMKPGAVVCFGQSEEGGEPLLTAEVLSVVDDGNRIIRFYYNGIWEEILDKLGEMPLPPYITHKLQDKNRYQTVYAKNSGSAAAPTAGLHFTEEMLKDIEAHGVKIARLTLHVGLGTFRPVKVEKIEEHHMHSEYFELSEEAAKVINETKAAGGRVIAVGTTSTRTLETVASRLEAERTEGETEENVVRDMSGWTDIFIYPGYRFKVIDGLITNFHLPESTLIMLVSAFYNREGVLAAYEEAVRERYRFFSFGDASFWL
ncbi:MAG: tRNA preQ1(34) S-adenosylmethionine ribosyltransferase-isomerase QueA [Eubacterium sp.]|nr:tRNA preQ1(34) S-adenosylmethionine ribosyltransferase-isomerase QueA [Eubacterium sp.]